MLAPTIQSHLNENKHVHVHVQRMCITTLTNLCAKKQNGYLITFQAYSSSSFNGSKD